MHLDSIVERAVNEHLLIANKGLYFSTLLMREQSLQRIKTVSVEGGLIKMSDFELFGKHARR